VNGDTTVNAPTDPLQLLIYGVATIIVVLALKLWDRRRDRRLQTSVDTAVDQASIAAQHAADAKDSAAAVALSSPTTKTLDDSTAQILQVGQGVERSVLYLAEQIGELRGELRATQQMLDLRIVTDKVRRAHDRTHS
jgi:hypothetical protein